MWPDGFFGLSFITGKERHSRLVFEGNVPLFAEDDRFSCTARTFRRITQAGTCGGTLPRLVVFESSDKRAVE
ncbi:MAG TPA: hypothetical protein DEF45_06485 [Rhodopirellula sp.]|nr:hypothetical protein [Rhodopirellula sp.]